MFSHEFFNSITLVPDVYSDKHIHLPANCNVIAVNTKNSKLSIKELFNCFYIVFTDFFEYPSKINYIKSFRNNLALIKNLSLKAKNISKQLPDSGIHTIVYAYWADNLLTTACILKQQFKNCSIVSRAHGFEVFEEQTRYNVIPFRKFQNKFSTKIFADSKNGYQHLLKKNTNSNIYSSSYVGTLNNGMAVFNENETFTIVSCSHIRNVKRLHLMANILQHISFPLVWNIIGTGDDLELVMRSNSRLPKHIRVNYLGNLTNLEVLSFYKTHHLNLFVSLSYSEGLPVSMMEAQSFGIPIMSTNVGGCSEICNEETGILIPKDFEPKEVANKILEFKNSEKNTLKFRQQCRNYWEKNFSAETNYTRFSREIALLK
jgi:glycosyltransferase involved in cell wall biosynthesis